MTVNKHDENFTLESDSIIKHFSSKKETVLTFIQAFLVFTLTVAVIILICLFLMSAIQNILDDETISSLSVYMALFIAVGLFFLLLWPIATIFIATVTSLGVMVTAAKVLTKGEYIPTSKLKINKFDKKVQKLTYEELDNLFGEKPRSIIALKTTNVAHMASDWHRTQTSRGVYNILRVQMPHSMAPILINSFIENENIIIDSTQNGVIVDINDQISQYFRVTTVPGAEQEVYELLTPNVLWELLLKLDSCDTLISGTNIYFVWFEYSQQNSIFEGREQSVSKFVSSMARNISKNTTINNKLRIKPYQPLFNTYKSVIYPAIILALVFTIVAIILAALNSHTTKELENSILLGSMFFVPGVIVSLCLMLSIALFFVALRTMRYILFTILSLPMISKYMKYYENRK